MRKRDKAKQDSQWRNVHREVLAIMERRAALEADEDVTGGALPRAAAACAALIAYGYSPRRVRAAVMIAELALSPDAPVDHVVRAAEGHFASLGYAWPPSLPPPARA